MPAAISKAAFKGLLYAEICASLHAIKAAALIVWGDKDSICALVGQIKMRRKIRGSRLIIYSGTGHALHWEEPDRFTNDLLQFLKTIQEGIIAQAALLLHCLTFLNQISVCRTQQWKRHKAECYIQKKLFANTTSPHF